VGTLVPVIGLVQVGDQAWADRYTYLPSVGFFVALVWGLGEIAGATRLDRRVVLSVALAAGVALLAATSVQLSFWKNTRTLFTRAAQVTPDNPLAITVLGSLLAQEGKLDQAMESYRAALQLQPGFPQAHFFLANALEQQGELEQAVAEYQQALWFKPAQEQTHIFLGITLARQGKSEEAIAHYIAALTLNPDSAVAHNNLARLLHSQGRLAEAAEHYQAALALNPKLALTHNNLGILLVQKGEPVRGTVHLREALRLNPTNSETQFNLALALNQQARWEEAAAFFSKVMDSRPAEAKAHAQFAMALAHLKRTREAMAQYAAALLLQPDLPNALDGLAWILSTANDPAFRNGPEAVRMAERAAELTGRKDPARLKTLAAAYAEAGRFEEATAALKAAEDLAAEAQREELARDCRGMSEQFRLSKPWRD
jgi:tetratricopeptide (TPR) repeat protein